MAGSPASTLPAQVQKSTDSKDGGVEFTESATLTESKPGKQPSSSSTTTKPNRRAPSFNPSDDDRIVIINDESTAKNSKSKPSNTKNTTPSTKSATNETFQKQTTPATQSKQEKVTTKPTTQDPTPSTPKNNAPAASSGKAVVHVVEAGQTFYSISKIYDVTVNDILYWNNLTQDAKLLSGQKLNIRPVGNTLDQQPKAAEFITHTVAQGETMFSISQKYGVKVDLIKEWNELPDTGVKIGQQIKIKKQ